MPRPQGARPSATWLAPVIFGAALLAATVGIGFALHARAAAVLEEELDQRLLSTARIAAGGAAERLAAGVGAAAFLEQVRAAANLENVFALDAAGGSLADARASFAPGQRYSLLDYDADLLARAIAGGETLSARYELEGIALKAAYVPIPGGALVVEASPAFVERLRDLRGLLWLSAALGLGAALVFAAVLAAARRRLARSAEASLASARLALAGRLAAQVAHEIKNPLAILRGSAQLAEQAAREGLDPARHVVDLIEEVDRIDALVEDFLSLSRDVALRKAACDLNAIAERAAALAEVGAGRSIARAPAIPAPQALADERRLRQALLGLLFNAVQSGAAQVTVRTGAGDGGAWIEVADDGPGMDAATLARAGEPFFTTRAGGTGLGLTVARQIAEAHGGRLALESAPGAGTRARVWLPAVPDGTQIVPERSPQGQGAA